MTDDQIKELANWSVSYLPVPRPGMIDFARACGEMSGWIMGGLGVPAELLRGDQHYPAAPEKGQTGR